MFQANALFYTDGYKLGHKAMLAPSTKLVYGTWIPRSLKHAPSTTTKIVSFGQRYVARRLHDVWNEFFFKRPIEEAINFGKDIEKYLGLEYDAQHFIDLHKLGYLPYRIKALPEGVRTKPNVPHMTLTNTLVGNGSEEFAWLTLYLETFISQLAWKLSTSATLSYEAKKNAVQWVSKTDPTQIWLADYMCHDFSARGLSESDAITSGLGHIINHNGTDSIITIPASRYYYGVKEDEMPVASVNASEHSVSTTKIFTVGEKQMLSDWFKLFPKGILSVVSDTFDLFKLLNEYARELKSEIMGRDGKVVFRPDSGDQVKIVCGEYYPLTKEMEETIKYDDNGNGLALFMSVIKNDMGYKGYYKVSDDTYHDIIIDTHAYSVVNNNVTPQDKGVVKLLWEIFGGTVNDLGYRLLDSHVGVIYGDGFSLTRQVEMYAQLERMNFTATNLVLGAGSYFYGMNSRDTLGFAAKGSYFEIEVENELVGYDIYKDPATDDGTKKSLKGLMSVRQDENGEIYVKEQCTWEEEGEGLLQTIYENGNFYNQNTLSEIRERLKEEINKEL